MRDRLLYLVRHGETEGESSIRYHGRSDVPLSEVGRGQIHRLAPRLREVRFTALVYSPLRRARESGEILARELATPPLAEAEPDFAEVHFGRIEGMTDAEIAARWPDWHRDWKAGRAGGYPGGETLAGFAARVAAAFDRVLERHRDGDLLVVAHRGVIKWGLAHLLGLGADEAGAIAPELGSLSIARHGATSELLELNVLP